MNFTDIFIKRPVLSTVVSLLILVLGLRAIFSLGVREYPETQNAVVTVTTAYTGADAGLIAGFITTPLENSIAQANGIDYLTSTSSQNVSQIKATLRLNYDSNKALTEINSKVNAVLNQLPKDAQQPTITVAIGQSVDSMYISFHSKVLPNNKISDYLIRVVQPKLQAVEGVQKAEILGNRQFAMRIWLDPIKLASFKITPFDVSNALAANNFISAVGRTKGKMISIDLTASTGLHTVAEFKELILRNVNGAVVRLKDVGTITLGSEDYDSIAMFDNDNAVFIGIKVAPTANLLTVIDKVRQAFPAIEKELPEGIEGKIVYDATKYVNSSIHEVIKTLLESLLIVMVVIFLFLGSFRTVLIPTLAMPLSLIGAFFMMLVFGYTINLLTLLALVLAIGLVVDDAIIIVENIHRHIEAGMSPLEASIQGTRELAMPIVAISVVLVAVYVPIGFMGGLTGALFTEFAFTLAGAVAISAIVALTLSPMMSSKILQAHHDRSKRTLVDIIDARLNALRVLYEKFLHGVLEHLSVVVVFSIIIIGSIFYLFQHSNSELAPVEDPGFIMAMYKAAPSASLAQTQLYSTELYKEVRKYKEVDHVFQIDGFDALNSGFAGFVLTPWDQRKLSASTITDELQMKLGNIPGLNSVAFLPPPLPGGGEGLPIQFVIQTTDSFERLNEIIQEFIVKAQASGIFGYLDTDLKVDKPETEILINREKAASLNLRMSDVGTALGTMLGGGYVNYFNLGGRSYKVIPQVQQGYRLNADQLRSYYITTPSGHSVPLSTIVDLKTKVTAETVNHFQQQNAATIFGMAIPGVTIGKALSTLQGVASEILPQGYTVDYAGQSRQFIKESQSIVYTFIFAFIIIFLVLAAQFESFRDPFIVLISVPMSICGAMIFISLGVGGASLNIYTQVGLITLIGLISKHGILIVQFANDLQKEGKSKRQAIELAAGIRLRPILMTTAAMVVGVLPLITASGAGAAGRFNMGLVISTGIAIGTFFTLFVVPSMYLLLAADHSNKMVTGTSFPGETHVKKN